MRHRTLIGLALAAAIAVGGCGGTGDSGAAVSPKAALTKILRDVEAAGVAAPVGEVGWYEPDRLFELIDGDAVRFVDAGFVLLAHAEWKPAGAAAAKPYVEMDIYDLATPAGAMDLLCDSRSDGAKFLPLGNEAIGGDDMLELRAGRYYVKLTPRHDPAALKPVMKALAEAVAKAVPAGPSDEKLVAPLPADKMIPHTAAFYSKGYLGRDFLGGVREAAYEAAGGKRVRLFVLDAGAEDKAKALLAEWKESVPAAAAKAQTMPNTVVSTDEFQGTIIITRKDHRLAGTVGDEAAGHALLEAFLKHLE